MDGSGTKDRAKVSPVVVVIDSVFVFEFVIDADGGWDAKNEWGKV